MYINQFKDFKFPGIVVSLLKNILHSLAQNNCQSSFSVICTNLQQYIKKLFPAEHNFWCWWLVGCWDHALSVLNLWVNGVRQAEYVAISTSDPSGPLNQQVTQSNCTKYMYSNNPSPNHTGTTQSLWWRLKCTHISNNDQLFSEGFYKWWTLKVDNTLYTHVYDNKMRFNVHTCKWNKVNMQYLQSYM